MRAFSLVELSIVLVILGLLTGGVLTGQSLIRAAELRAVTSEYQRYTTAIHTFRNQYMALPGDFRDATRFWGYQGITGCTNNAGTAAVANGVCDGTGDGQINIGTVSNASSEPYQAWRQLARAGLVEGQYTGQTDTVSVKHSVIGQNVPASKLSNAGWTLHYLGARSGHAYWFDKQYEHVFFFGAQEPQWETFVPVLRPEEAWNIDVKLDDGKPGTGAIMEMQSDGITSSTNSTARQCTTTQLVSTAEYNVRRPDISCMLLVNTGY